MTIKDLAAKTGYAVGTVSRVLNNHPNVSEKARTAILAAVEESGFQLNVNARQLKQAHGTSILVILKGSGNILFAEMLENIQTALHGTRYPLHVDYIHGADNEVRRAKTLVREKKCLGVIFLGGNLDNFREEFQELGADIFTVSRGMVNTMADIKNVAIWVNFTESETGVLCEIRSNKYNINPIAVKYGGGGHAKASGATVADRETAMAMLRDLDEMMGEEA